MKCKLLLSALILLISCFGNAQNDTSFWNSKMLSIANSGGGNGWIRIKEGLNFSMSDFFIKNADAFRLSNNDNMAVISSKTDTLGYTHYLLQQKYKGIKIEGAEYKLHEQNGQIITANGNLVIGLTVNNVPNISMDSALQNALTYVNATKYAWEVKNCDSVFWGSFPIGELVYAKKNDSLSFSPINFTLAYKFDIFSIEPYSRNYIYIDAMTGNVLKTLTRIISDCDCCDGTAQTLYNGQQTIVTHHRWLANDYILKDNCRGNGIHTYLAGNNVDDGDNQWSILEERPATSGHWAMEMTYDFYLNTYNRNGFDNSGAEMLAYTDDNSNGQDNAYWNGSTFHFGSGGGGLASNALVSLDCVGHEFTHAVTQNEANLTYSYESGALNESFSDIFGTMVEFYIEGNSGNYIIGEDFWIQDGKLRDMQNPNSKYQPDTYNGVYWWTSSGDNGGVHTNSGVQNFWFYLLAEGGSGTNDNGESYIVQGIGRDKAAAIAYRNLSIYLTSSSGYSDAKNGAIWSAMDIYGNCSNEVLQTIKAWDAVGVSSVGGFDYDIIVNCASLAMFHEGLGSLTPQPVTFRAINDLAANCAIISNGQPVTFIAGSSIKLTDGLISGDNFHAYIDPCLESIQLKTTTNNTENNITTPSNSLSDSIQRNSTKNNYYNDEKIKDFSVFPNPSTGLITVNLIGTYENAIMHIYDINGKLIISKNLTKSQFTVDLKEQEKGVYFICLIFKKNICMKKIILE